MKLKNKVLYLEEKDAIELFCSMACNLNDLDESCFRASPLSYLSYPTIETDRRHTMWDFYSRFPRIPCYVVIYIENQTIQLCLYEHRSRRPSYKFVVTGDDEEFQNYRKMLIQKRKQIILFYQDCMKKCMEELK